MRLHRLNFGVTFVLGLLLVGVLLLVLPVIAQQAQPRSFAISPGATISESSPAVSTIIVGETATITDVNVVVNINHTHSGDLRITLRHESTGTTVTLLSWLNGPAYAYGCGSDGIAVVFDDSAGAPLDSYDCSGNFDGVVTGTWRASNALSAFNGQNINGRWTLRIEDTVPTDNGVLNSWGIVFGTDQPVPTPIPGDDGPTPEPTLDVISQVLGGGSGGSSAACVRYDAILGQPDVVLTDNFDDMFGVLCRVIAQDSVFVRSGAEIGNKGVLDLGVIHAVDVYTTNRTDPAGREVCLRGRGDMIFLNATRAPRVPEFIASTQEGSYTCVTIPAVGTLVLVDNAPEDVTAIEVAAPAQVPSGDPRYTLIRENGRPVSVSAGTALTGCRIRTNYALNIRTAPFSDSVVIDMVPFEITLTATERTEEWFRVIYEDYQGWLNAEYLETIGSCG